MKYDYLIVGAGFSGAVLAERLSSVGKKVLVVEKRNHIGGNCYDFFNKSGNYIQKYGPHIFHTNDEEVWDYLSQFTKWNNYTHKVLVKIKDKLINIPFNLNSIDLAFTKKEAEQMKSVLIKEIGLEEKVPILELNESKNPLVKKLADFVYNYVFLGYTIKQWGLKPDEIDPSVTARVPVFISKDNRYFQDKFQGIPAGGFTKMFKKMLRNKNIKLILNKDFKNLNVGYKKLFYTGPLDYFFNYKFGPILYRRINLKFEEYSKESFQDNSVINYPNNYKFTRKTEFNKFLFIKNESTVVAKEYASWNRGFLAYPVQSEKNQKIVDKYMNEAKNLKNVVLIGRLAECKYYNMDQAVKEALNAYEKNA